MHVICGSVLLLELGGEHYSTVDGDRQPTARAQGLVADLNTPEQQN